MEGDKPSTKIYTIDSTTGTCEKGKVDQAYMHDSTTITINNLVDLYDVIWYAREESHRYIIRGHGVETHQQLVRRTKLQEDNVEGKFYEEPTSWICCDFDKYIVPNVNRTSIEAIEWLIKNELPKEFHNVSYIYQWSSSAGLEYNGKAIKDGTNVHLFFWLDRGLLVDEYKSWFSKEIEKGFDPSTFNTVTPIYVNSHVEKDQRIVDIIKDSDKFGIVAKEQQEVKVPEITVVKDNYTYVATDIDLANDIMKALNEIGAIYGRRSGWILLRHPQEKTPGDWHLKPHSPQVVHHHVQKSKRIDKWIKEFYGIEKKFDFPKFNDSRAHKYATNIKNNNNLYRKEHD